MEPEQSEAGLDVRHVVLPLDGSSFAAAALPTARALAERFGADLTTVSVAADEEDAEELRRHTAEVGGEAGDSRSHIVVGGDPARAIIDAASVDGSVIVMSTHGRGRVAGAVMGSVARSVLASASQPLIAVGPHGDRPSHLVGRPRRRPDSWPEPFAAREVVALVDGKSASETAIAAAARWARALEAQLVILNVAEDAPAGLDGVRSNRFGPADPAAYIQDLADRWRSEKLDTRAKLVYDPLSVASGVAAYLASHPTALVVLAASGRSGVERLRLGATAADIVRALPVPALVVPKKG